MKNLKINKNKIKALLGAIVISTNLTACSFKKADTDTKQTYSLENSILKNDDVQYLYVNDTLVPISDVKLMDKSKNIIESVDGVLVNSEIMNISNPVEIKFSNDIEGVILGNKIIPVTEFILVNGNTKEEITSIEGVFIDNKLVSVSLNDNSLIDLENDDIGYTDIDTDDEYELLTTEKFEKLNNKIIEECSSAGLSVLYEDVKKYVMIVNIDKLNQDNRELIEEIKLTPSKKSGQVQSSLEIYHDSDDVSESRKTYNFEYYNKYENMDGFLWTSSVIFDQNEREKVKTMESDLRELFDYRNDTDKFNEKLNLMLNETFNSAGLYKFESGTGREAFYQILGFIWSYFNPEISPVYSARINEENLDLFVQIYTTKISPDLTIYTSFERQIGEALNGECEDVKTRTK